ncbi:hypothetical protein [Pseudomonas sp. EL_65y_Pfl2_R95]|uniref:hypothetical protein n=1 Tax=Pseudomonas sp. EL_65y_Pfl2_R95 TaxID=3088698 RepID=UPI0030DB26D9
MKNAKRVLAAIVFSIIGVSAHANAAGVTQRCDTAKCFLQAAPVVKDALQTLTENGSSRTPQGRNLEMIVENGYSHTPQSNWLQGKAPAYQV